MRASHLRFSMDGISYLFVLLVAGLVTLVPIAASLRLKGKGDRAYFALILVLQTALFGVFTARHFIPWFLCWEMTLIPAYLLIRLWGGPGRAARRAAVFHHDARRQRLHAGGFLALQLSAAPWISMRSANSHRKRELADALAILRLHRPERPRLLTGRAVRCFSGLR
jgi:NADH-quinone oxidoreductase subunit M